MKSNTDMPQTETPFEKYRDVFSKDDKKVLTPIVITLVVVLVTFVFLNMAAAGYGYKNSMPKSSYSSTCQPPYAGVRYYVLPGYLAGCWFGSK